MKKSYEQAKRRREDGIRYKHDLGQHFLYDEALLSRLVEQTGVSKQDRVLEIGPGSGMLTRRLCEAAAQVLAVEVDGDVLPFLRVRTEGCGNLTIVQGDVRKLDLATLCKPLGEGFFVIANIPYNITAPILDLLLDGGLPIRRACLMVQKEVAEKLLADPSSAAYGMLSVKCRYRCEPSLAAEVPAEAFTPPPKVDSAFVRLDWRAGPPLPVRNEALLMRMVRAGFGMRRKTLCNALKGLVEGERLKAALERAGLSATVRGEALSVEQWICLANGCAE